MSGQNIPSPDRVIGAFVGYRLTAAVRTGVDIDLFTAIAEGCVSPDALAARCQVDARGVRILADFLAIHELLTKKNGAYALTAESDCYLNRRSPRFFGKTYSFTVHPSLWDQFGRLTEIVRQGGARSQAVALAPNHDMWLNFARDGVHDMAKVARSAIPSIQHALRPRGAHPLRILDVAAGHGMFGITFAKDDPTCRVVAQDWPAILAVTRQHALAHGVADRITFLPGDIMQADIGADYDVVMIPNLIHYLGRHEILQLLKRVKSAMKPGGILAIIEFAPDDCRIHPSFGWFALFSLVTSPDGDAYTVNEILRMCQEAGFENPGYCDLPWERLMLATNPKPAPRPTPTAAIGVVVTGSQFPAAFTANA